MYNGVTTFKGIHEKDALTLSDAQRNAFLIKHVSDIFPGYYLIKVNQFNGVTKDGLDEWIYFLKNSEVRDDFKARGLKEAGEALDVMRLPEDDLYTYNRYLDYLHYKAGEIFSLRVEAEERVREEERQKAGLAAKTEMAINAMLEGFDDLVIARLTKLSIEQIKEIRNALHKK